MSNLAHLHARRASISLTTAPQCHSCFDELICYSVKGLNPGDSVRVKGGMSLRNGMWHGLRNDIIMRNLIYAAE